MAAQPPVGVLSIKFQIPAMLASASRGSIVNNAPIGGVRGIPGMSS